MSGVREVPFGEHDSRRKIRNLVKEEAYDEIAALATHDAKSATELVKLLEDSEAEVRENAAEAIGRIGDRDLDAPEVLKEVVVPELMNLLRSSRAQVREGATYAFSRLAEMDHLWEDYLEVMEPPLERLIDLLGDPEVEVRKHATVAIRGIVEWLEAEGEDLYAVHSAIPLLSDLLSDPSEGVRKEAVQVLRPLVNSEPEARKSAVGGVIELLKSSYDSTNNATRLYPCTTLREMAGKYPELLSPAIPYLQRLLKDPWNIVRCNAAIVLVSVAEETSAVMKPAMAQLMQLLEDPKISAYYLVLAVRTLGRIAEKHPQMARPMLPLLTKLLDDSKEEVREGAARILRHIKGGMI